MSAPRPPQLLAVALAALVIGAAAYWLLAGGASPDDTPPRVVIDTLTSRELQPGSVPAAPIEPPPVPIARILIPAIDVDAAVEIRGASADGVMENPTGPHDVAWYNFTALPNQPGNIVMAGHLDYVNVGAAVFYHLDELQPGDEVLLNLEDGTSATYRVTSVHTYDADEAPVQEIVGPTEVETLTLITCGGTFNASTREYDERVIVRAERSGAAGAPAG